MVRGWKVNTRRMFCSPMFRLTKVTRFLSFFRLQTLFESVGLMPSADRPSSTVCSYNSVHDELAAKGQAYSGKYQQFVLEYAIEKIV
jgi:hypothetical protein